MSFNSPVVLRTSRKDRACDGCRQKIAKGDKYHNWSGMFDGTFFAAHFCRVCYDLMHVWPRPYDDNWFGYTDAYFDAHDTKITSDVEKLCQEFPEDATAKAWNIRLLGPLRD